MNTNFISSQINLDIDPENISIQPIYTSSLSIVHVDQDTQVDTISSSAEVSVTNSEVGVSNAERRLFEFDRKRKTSDTSSSTPVKARSFDELVNCAHPGCPYATTRVIIICA